MSTSSSVVQLGAVSSMSGPHSILEIGERNEQTPDSQNDITESTKQGGTSPIENNHIQESVCSTLMNQLPTHPNDCVSEENEENPVAVDFTTVDKRPPPLEVCFSILFNSNVFPSFGRKVVQSN